MATTEELKEAAKSYAMGVVKGNTADTLGAPVDLVNTAIAPVTKALGIHTETPFGGASHFRSLLNMDMKDKNAAETAGSLLSVGGAAKAMIVGAARLGKIDKNIDVLKAEELITKNPEVNAGSVYNLTGVYKGSDDGKLRAAISDKNAKIIESDYLGLSKSSFSSPAGMVEKLEDVLSHPELFRLYPEFKDLDVVTKDLGKGVSGGFNKETGTIFLSNGLSTNKQKEVILHEIQHAVQGVEGWTKGSNPKEFLPPNIGEQSSKIQKIVTEGRASSDPLVRQRAEAIKENFNKQIQTAHTQYENVPGEQEARFTADTMDLSIQDLSRGIRNMLQKGQDTQNWDTQKLPPAVSSGTVVPPASNTSQSMVDRIKGMILNPK